MMVILLANTRHQQWKCPSTTDAVTMSAYMKRAGRDSQPQAEVLKIGSCSPTTREPALVANVVNGYDESFSCEP